MRGYGLTVFRGVTIERFDVTVVAVVRNGSLVAPGHDMILVRMSGGPMTQRGANLIRGMSGSPVYIGGKCIGAFSQGEPTTKEPLGGVTPIEDMLEAWDPKLPDKPDVAARGPSGARGRVVELARPIRAGGRRIGRIVFDAPVSREPASAGTLRLRPCTSMVTISGGSRTARKRLAALLEPYGVEVMQAPSGASGKPIRGASLAPGAAFSAMLLLGDVESGATGTVTYRKGDRLLGFGHPFMGIGPLSAPICTATIHDVYPLNAGSYKISTPGPSLGATLQDRAFGISAVIGKSPELIPITVDVDDKTSGRSRVYRMRAVSHPNLYSGLVGLAVGSAVADMHGTPGPVMARVETVIESVTMGRIERRNYVYDARAIDMAVTSDLESILNVLASNPFEPQGIRSAMVRAVIEPGRRTATLDRVSVGAARYEPGDTVDVGVVLRPYRSAPVTMTIPVAIPEDAPNGPLTLTVRGGGAPPAMSIGGLTFRPSSPAAPDQSPPVNVRQMLDRVLEREMGDEIGARLALPTTSVSIEGRALRGLPPTLDAALRSPRVSSVRTDRDEVRATLKTEWVVTGQQMLTINVQREPSVPPGPRSAAPATGLSPGSSPGTPSRPPQGAAMSQTQGRTASQRTTATSQGKAEQPAKPDTTKPNQAVQAPPASATPSATEKPVARVPKVWRQTAREDWVKATLDGVGLSSSGEMALAPSVRRLCSLPGAIVWSLVSDGGSGVYAGLGPEALVCHVGPDGKVETVAALPEVSVHALWRSPDGALYAGTAPQGRTYRIRQGAKPEVVHDAAEPYVLALTGTVDGSVLIGAGGSGGAVYSLSPSGAASALASGLDRHVMSLAVGPDGSVYAGTSGRGTVVRLRAGTTPHVLLDAPGQSFSSLAVMKGGDIVAGAGPRGALYRVAPDGSWRNIRLSEQAPGVASLVATPSGELLVAGGAAISRIGPTDARLQ
ncbi:MAG: hypothetical protein FJX72_14865, partial [Armatimonadetes bacterium]|nr:hypothetical protein [Armatimonadota bacterium]